MPTTPQVLGPDGVYRTDFVFSTTLQSRFFTGSTSDDTVDMEVSIREGDFTNDPDLISFEGDTWMIPNPAAYPDGLELVAGENTIEIRSVSSTGSVSASATVSVTLIQERDVGFVVSPPTAISIERFDSTVRIKVEGLDDSDVVGYNFYASQYEGGGSTGYQRINVDTVIAGETEEVVEELSSQEITYDVVTEIDGTDAGTPVTARFVGTQVDTSGAESDSDFDISTEISSSVGTLRTTVTVESVREITLYSFDHDRLAGPNSDPPTITIGAFTAIPNTDSLYYVVTAIYYDSTNAVEIESSYSVEVAGNPLRVRASLGNFPVVSRQQIARQFTRDVHRSYPYVQTHAGAFLHDTVIGPFSKEAEKIRLVLDFLHRAQSFSSLLQIDDPTNTGESIDVSSNPYKRALKQAFSIVRDADIQDMIDRCFEQLAANYGIYRISGRFSRGEVTFFTTVRPDRTLSIPLGTTVQAGSITFRTTRAAEIPLARLASFRDQTTGRYFVRVPVQATQAGTTGNVGAGQIRKIQTAIAGLSVTNESAMFGGTNTETNKQLAERALNALASVDSGTARGYLQTVATVPGVIQAYVVSATHPMMERDFDDATGQHRGGKVDIWVQGESSAEVTDTFAFESNIAQNVQFELIDVDNLEFRAVDDDLSSENPIVEMLDFPTVGYELRNATTGEIFDLTDVEITAYNTIRLSTDVTQPAVSLTDVVLGDYRRRTSSRFEFTRQPVRSIVEVVGTVSGTLPEDSYSLGHPSSPLRDGRSTLSEDYLLISGTTDDDGNALPSGELIEVTDEEHVLVGEYPEYLENLGANFLTIQVWNEDRSVEYRGPNDTSGVSDYTIILGDATTPVAIQRIASGDIASGETVLVDYYHDENFTVRYEVNLVVQVAQEAVDAKRHLTADVVVKDAIDVGVDIEATVILESGAIQSTVDQALRTNLANYFAALRLGQPVRQSDIASVIDNTTGVSYVVLPLAKLARSEGSVVVKESLASSQPNDVVYLSAYSTSLASVWMIQQELTSNTVPGGGPESEFRGVFQDSALLTAESVGSAVGLGSGRAYIIGSDGLVISGYTDSTTLTGLGYTTSAEREQAVKDRTANRVLVSTAVGDSPSEHTYTVTYTVGEDTGANNIDCNVTSYLTLGEVTFTYDEDV